MLPPLIIVKGHEHLVGWYQELHNTQDEVLYHRCSENGWTDNQMALSWLEQIFAPHSQSMYVYPEIFALT